jgi:sugar/nucleoside kinase (ribokinase family)
MSLLVVGSTAFDAIETPFGKIEKVLGGSAPFICLAAAKFTKPVRLVSVVGADFPESDLAMLADGGVDLAGLQKIADGKTMFWSGKYHTDMNSRDTLITELNVLADFDPTIPDSYNDTDYLMLGNLSPTVQRQVLERLPKRPKLVVMDTMNFWMSHTPAELAVTLKLIDVLCINDSEARELSGEYSLRKAARKIMEMGPKTLIIKKGEHGALLFQGEQLFFAPALLLEDVFDPTGAGDTFAGGFAGYLAATDDISFENMKRAIIYGSALASFSVEEFGPQRLHRLTEEELNSRVQTFVDLVQYQVPVS